VKQRLARLRQRQLSLLREKWRNAGYQISESVHLQLQTPFYEVFQPLDYAVGLTPIPPNLPHFQNRGSATVPVELASVRNFVLQATRGLQTRVMPSASFALHIDINQSVIYLHSK